MQGQCHSQERKPEFLKDKTEIFFEDDSLYSELNSQLKLLLIAPKNGNLTAANEAHETNK